MDHMDFDHILEVPDTPPDRLVTRNTTEQTGSEQLNSSFMIGSLGQGNHFSPRSFSRSCKSGHHVNPIVLSSGDSSSSRTNRVSRRNVAARQDFNHLSNTQNKKSLFIPPSSGVVDLSEDLSERNRHASVHIKASPSGAPRVTQVDDNNNAARKSDSVTLNSICVPRGIRHKRLVRNGCISPINIAKGKQPVEKDNSDSVPVAANASTSSIDVFDIVADDHNLRALKGKGVIDHHFSKNVTRNHKPIRSSLIINEKASESGVARGDGVRNFEGSGGWRSTHSQNGKQYPPMSRQGQHITIEDGVGQCNGNKGMRRQNEANDKVQISDTCARLRKNKGVSTAEDPVAKRQKQGSTSSGLAECSRSTADDSDVMHIGSPVQTRKSRLNRNKNHNGSIDEAAVLTPEVQHVHEDAAAQVELDEMLARELQEQFYNEQTAVGSEQIDAHIAMALQQEEESRPTVPRRRQPVSNPRGRSARGRAQAPSSRGGAQAPSSSRLASLRSRFPGQSRTTSSSRGRNSATSSRQRNPLFPADMDVDMRMHILEALESLELFGGTGMGQRDFNENDYEMLLALDENNHQHAGANTRHINELPQSTVQNDNLEEACAICLDNPTVGDIIRHLPCFHKFHKDCIDPWLRRRPSCPVCKSSIA